jgi:hypothetical protein
MLVRPRGANNRGMEACMTHEKSMPTPQETRPGVSAAENAQHGTRVAGWRESRTNALPARNRQKTETGGL